MMSEPETSVAVTIAPEMAGWRLDRAMAALVPTLSRERLKALISAGHLSQTRDPATKVKAGTAYSLTVPAPTVAHNVAQDIAIDIVYEDDHLLVVDKPAGLVVHPAAGNLDGTLVNALLHHCAGRLSGIGGVARPGIVHRIDKDTSGLLVVAKTDRAHEGLASQFADHSIDRRYQAIVAGVPLRGGGTIDAPLARSPVNRQKIAICAEGRGKRAVTHYRMLEPLRDAALIECRCACTWPQSIIRCSATRFMGGQRPFTRAFCENLASRVRRSTRHSSVLFIPLIEKIWRLKAKCPLICSNYSPNYV
jgi:23S rRNA pseudouridine1911/1915/1917 synthase